MKIKIPLMHLLVSRKRIFRIYVSDAVDKKFVAKQYLTIFKLSNAQNYKPILVQFDKVKQIRTKNGCNSGIRHIK